LNTLKTYRRINIDPPQCLSSFKAQLPDSKNFPQENKKTDILIFSKINHKSFIGFDRKPAIRVVGMTGSKSGLYIGV